MTATDSDAGLDHEGLFITNPNAMRTWTQRRIDPFEMTADDVVIEDIAHALARQCRYNGHCAGHLSVARHSIWVQERLEDEGFGDGNLLLGLLHDAGEAYIGDIIRPLKHNPAFGTVYAELERHVEACISEHFGLPFPHPPWIKEADDFVLTQRELGGPEWRWTYTSDFETDEADFLARYDAFKLEDTK